MSDINKSIYSYSCRICLSRKGTISIFKNKNENTICSMLMRITDITITLTDKLPDSICRYCEKRLENVFKFIKDVETADLKLRCFCSDTVDIKTEPENGIIDTFIEDIQDNVTEEIDDTNKFQSETIASSDLVELKKENDLFEAKSEKDLTENVHEIENDVNRCKKTKIKSATNLNSLENRTCKICGKVFARYISLKVHHRTHTGEKPYTCDICSKNFTQKSNLVLHIKTHSDVKSFICEVCSKQFRTHVHLKEHLVVHLPESAKQFKCDKCPKAFHERKTLLRHYKALHIGIKDVACYHCGKTFLTIAYLNIHIRTVHLAIKKHNCKECGKAFSDSSNLKAHFRIHTGEKPYECKYCESRFNQSTPLVRHTQHHIERGDVLKTPKDNL